MNYALHDCPMRVVVSAPQSKIGYTYPNIFIEHQPRAEALNIDITLATTSRMSIADFDECFNSAEPISTPEVCKQLGFKEDVFRKIIRQYFPDTCTVEY